MLLSAGADIRLPARFVHMGTFYLISQLVQKGIISPMSTELESNVFNTALLFEGGSMRAAYTSAVVS